MGLQPECSGACIMEQRFQRLEELRDKQNEQYLKDRVLDAIQMTEMKSDLKSILAIQKTMSTNLSKVLEENQRKEVQEAANKNEVSASKWKSLSAGTKAILVAVIGSTLVIVAGYLFNLLVTK